MPITNYRGALHVELYEQLPNGKRRRHRRKVPEQTMVAAYAFEARLKRQLGLSTSKRSAAASKERRLNEFAFEFIERYAAPRYRMSTLETTERHFRLHILPMLGGFFLTEIEEPEADDLTAELLEKGLVAKTVRNILGTLHRALAIAKRWRYIQRVPDIEMPAVDEPDFRYLEAETKHTLYGAVDPQWEAMVKLAGEAGLRNGELRALKPADLRLEGDEPQVTVRWAEASGIVTKPKSKRIRTIPLTSTAVDALKRHARGNAEWFFHRADGDMLSRSQTRYALYKACDRAELDRFGWHTLRHTFASLAVLEGVALPVIQSMLGHSTLAMTERYLHVNDPAKRAAIKLMERAAGTHRNNGNSRAPNSAEL